MGRSRDGCIKIGYVVIVERKGAGLGVNLGHPIVTMGSLLRSCAEVREPIELSFRVMSGIGSGIHLLDVGECVLRGRVDFGVVHPYWPMVSVA